MAYNQAPSRSPLIDNSLKEALQRRGTEILGLILIAISIGIFLLLWSYLPTTEVSGLLAMNLLKIY